MVLLLFAPIIILPLRQRAVIAMRGAITAAKLPLLLTKQAPTLLQLPTIMVV